MANRKKKIAVGLSGGVDSSVTAALLQQQGYELVGLSMSFYDGSLDIKKTKRHACYGPGEQEDLDSAAAVCKKLGIPFHAIDLCKEYKKHVIDYFRSEYLAGRTPNPCIVCNRKLKFGFLLEKARDLGLDFYGFATGHYARIIQSDDRFLIKTALDKAKDQTYFLYALKQKQLAETFFLLGDYTKQQVRKIAKEIGLETAARPESQDFIASRDYAPLFTRDEIKPGYIVDKKGGVLGEHRGIVYYTIGQRKGLGIAAEQPLYVTKIDAENNKLIVDGRENLFSKGLIAKDVNLIAVAAIDQPRNVQVKVRLNHPAAEAVVFPAENDKIKVVFSEPQISVTPGQSAVIYLGDTLLGGGIIEHTF
jgi:tRNA-specific 2-thiouridylase